MSSDVEQTDEEPEEVAQVAETTDGSAWRALEAKLEARATFKTCATVAAAQLALDLRLSSQPVLEVNEDEVAEPLARLAEEVKQRTEVMVEKQRAAWRYYRRTIT